MIRDGNDQVYYYIIPLLQKIGARLSTRRPYMTSPHKIYDTLSMISETSSYYIYATSSILDQVVQHRAFRTAVECVIKWIYLLLVL